MIKFFDIKLLEQCINLKGPQVLLVLLNKVNLKQALLLLLLQLNRLLDLVSLELLSQFNYNALNVIGRFLLK